MAQDLLWIDGVVVHGDRRGKELGFPTANLVLDKETMRPADGIWAVWVKLADSPPVLKGVMHVGPRPTIAGAAPSVEIHILDMTDTDLYDKPLSFATVKWLRGVEKFSGLQALTDAIAADCDAARTALAE